MLWVLKTDIPVAANGIRDNNNNNIYIQIYIGVFKCILLKFWSSSFRFWCGLGFKVVSVLDIGF